MDKKNLKMIKKKLLGEKKRIQRELKQFTKKDSRIKDNFRAIFPSFGYKDDENAAEVTTFSDRLSIEHNLELSLRDINKALERIKEGTYGICVHCGRAINEERLLIRPTSSSCVECKKRLKGED